MGEDITLNERNQSPKDRQMILLYEVPKVVKSIETESRIMAAGGWGEGEQGVSVEWVQSTVLEDKTNGGDGCITI